MRRFYVYIMTNRSGTLYVGVTNNLQRRLSEHRRSLGSFTSRYRLVKLIYYEATEGPYAAITRERQIKGWTREKKLALIRTENPAMKDLAPQLFGWRAGQFSIARRTPSSDTNRQS
jgi:putative endonuclease